MLDSLLKSGEFSVGVRKTTFSHFVGGFEKPWKLAPNTGLFERVKGIYHLPTHAGKAGDRIEEKIGASRVKGRFCFSFLAVRRSAHGNEGDVNARAPAPSLAAAPH